MIIDDEVKSGYDRINIERKQQLTFMITKNFAFDV
jgi:hypothetical protein